MKLSELSPGDAFRIGGVTCIFGSMGPDGSAVYWKYHPTYYHSGDAKKPFWSTVRCFSPELVEVEPDPHDAAGRILLEDCQNT